MEMQTRTGKKRKRRKNYTKPTIQKIKASSREATVYGYEHYKCSKCGRIEKIYCEVGIEDVEGIPSPYEILCDECGGVMREMDYCHRTPEKRLAKGKKYFAYLPDKEVGTFLMKI